MTSPMTSPPTTGPRPEATTRTGAIRTHTNGPIGWIVIDHPARLNALGFDMWRDLMTAVKAAEADDAIRVVVVRGVGEKAFSAGADISEFETARAGDRVKLYDAMNNDVFHVLMYCAKPTIAMIHGICYGGGLEIAACCDMRLAAEGSAYSVPAAKLGIGYNPRWIRPVLASLSPAHAKEMLFTGRRFTAPEALAIGFLNRIVTPDALEAAVIGLAHEIAANAPLSIYAAKRAVDEFAYRPEAVDMAALDALIADCFHSEDYAEGRRAFMAKRKPVFKGR